MQKSIRSWQGWTAEGSVTYVLEKSRVSIRFISPYSEERRKKSSENGKKYGLYGICKLKISDKNAKAFTTLALVYIVTMLKVIDRPLFYRSLFFRYFEDDRS